MRAPLLPPLRPFWLASLLLLGAGCGPAEPAPDAGSERDGGLDAGDRDAGVDAGALRVDAGPRESRPNALSPLGTNLAGLADYSPERPFVNLFSTSRPWISGSETVWDDGRTVETDEAGWVASLRASQIARTLLMWDLEGDYPSGRYLVLYEGHGTLAYRGAATKVEAESAPGREVIEVDAEAGGIQIDLLSLDPSDPIRDLRVLPPGGSCEGDPAAYCASASDCIGSDFNLGLCVSFEESHRFRPFHPDFLRSIEEYSVLRFMDWMATNGSEQARWEDRPRLTDARYTPRGVPAERIVELSNTLLADPWVTVPHRADDDYVRALAELLRDGLDPSLRVYVEHSNEVWNAIFSQAGYAQTQGLRLGLSGDPYEAQIRYHAQRSVEIFAIFEEVFGGTERLVRVMGSQAANPWVSTTALEVALEMGGAAAATDALAIAPYFGGSLGSPAERERVAAMDLDALFAALRDESLPEAEGWLSAQRAAAEAAGVRLIAYEGGQHLAGHSGVEADEAINALFDAANRDPRMGELYGTYLSAWRSGGGELFVHFTDCSRYTRYGRWGALERLPFDPSAPTAAPKHGALRSFIAANERWW